MNRGNRLQLAVKVVGFAIVAVWVLTYLMFGILLFPPLFDYFEEIGISTGWTQSLLVLWFWGTLIATGAYMALKGMRFIGKWERKGEGEEEEVEPDEED